MSELNKMIDIIKQEFNRRLIEEGLTRIEKCLALLSEAETWHQDNDNSNSVGHLILHLAGNVGQYIVSGLGDALDMREREKEFDPEVKFTKKNLLNHISTVVKEADLVIKHLPDDTWTKKHQVQCFEESALSMIIHVIEHFSYHVGQITYITKQIKNQQTNYYKGLDLNKTQ